MNFLAGIAAFVVLWAGCLYFLRQENHHLARYLDRLLLPPAARGRLLRLAHIRSALILLLLFIFAGVSLGMGWKINSLSHELQIAAAAPQKPVKTAESLEEQTACLAMKAP